MKPQLTPSRPIAHDLGPFLGDVRPVALASRVVDWRIEGDDVVVTCATQRYEPRWVFTLGSPTEAAVDPVPGPEVELRVSGYREGVVRFRYAAADGPAIERRSPMLVEGGHRPMTPRVVESDTQLAIDFGAATVVIGRDPVVLEVRDPAGRRVWRTRPERLPFQPMGTADERTIQLVLHDPLRVPARD